MDMLPEPNTAAAVTLWLLILLLNIDDFRLPCRSAVAMDPEDANFSSSLQFEDERAYDTASVMRSTLQNFRLCASLNVYHDEMMFWVKPRSTTWFSKFLMQQYDQARWVSMFRMTQPALFALAEVIRPHVEKKNTRYRLAVPVVVRVACTLFKLCHGANLTICSEMFAVGKSSVSKILREVVHSINDCLKQEITWPSGERLRNIQRKFARACSLPGVVGALDGVHISIAKPHHCPSDYFYFKTVGYSINCQAVVDSDKRFLHLCVGMPGSTNDGRVLRRSTLYHLATHGTLFEPSTPVNGFSPFLIADSGYPLLPWLMTPHQSGHHLCGPDALLNKKLKKGRVVVENAFGILKQSFRELMGKSDLHLTFLPDVVFWCAILHNILLWQSHEDVEEFLRVLDDEGLAAVDEPILGRPLDMGLLQPLETAPTAAAEKRRQLGLYLSTRGRRPT